MAKKNSMPKESPSTGEPSVESTPTSDPPPLPTPRNWPAGINHDAEISTVLPGSSLSNPARGRGASLFEVMYMLEGLGDTPERHWLCAWLNAHAASQLSAFPNAANFPYKPDEVVHFYTAGNLEALTFFKDYLESYN